MTEFLLQLSLPLSLLLVALMLVQKWLLPQLGARNIYALWGAVPVLVVSMLLSPVLSTVKSSNAAIVRYQVSLQQLSGSAAEIDLLFYLWLTGFLAIAAFLLLSYCSNQALYRRATPLTLANNGAQYRQVVSKQGPYVSGFSTAQIVLPHDFFSRYTPLQQQLVLQHELTHWRRGDLHFNYLALLLLALCWFNPLCWLAYRYYRQAQELSCDAVVTEYASKAERIAYGQALLSSSQQPAAIGWPLTHHYGDYHAMKQRLLHIQQQQGFSRTLVLVAMTAVLAANLVLNTPVYAANDLAPTMRVEPRYPVEAAQQGIAGYVQLRFDVDASGKVQNAKVLKSNPEQVFDKEALRAVAQWQYTATGKVHKGQTVQLDFELDTPSEMERVSVTPQHK